MSLKLLQKQAANAGSGGSRGGRGRGRQARTMSLQEFQQSVNSTSVGTSGASRTVSAWGRGRPGGTAAGESPATPVIETASRGRGARHAPESRRSAWASGAPQSAADALWDKPAATPAMGESSWDEPVDDPETWDEQPSSWTEASLDAAPAVDWHIDDEAEADVPVATSGPAANASIALDTVQDDEEEEEEEFSKEVAAWLKKLKLSNYLEEVLAWCEDMGAATLQEVVDCIDDVMECIPMKPLDKKRMQANGAKVAAEIGSGSNASIRQADDSRDMGARMAPSPQDLASDGASGDVAHGDDVGDNASGSTWCPHGGSFPSRASSTGTYNAECGEASAAQSFYGNFTGADAADSADVAPGGFYATMDEGSRGFYASQTGAEEVGQTGEALDSELEDNYLKQRYTETATWLPTVKTSQSARKKRVSDQQKSSMPTEEEKSAAEEAARRLREQIEEEERRKTAEVQAVLDTAIESGRPDEIQKAIDEARDAGWGPDELKDAKLSLERTIRKQRQRRTDAVCALQAALEAPRDDRFGSLLLEALEAQSDAREAEGGRKAVEAAKAALSEWQVVQQQRQDAKMALQLAVRHDSTVAMRVALESAHKAGLADDDKLVIEASLKLREADEREALDAAAADRLQRAMEARDLDDLPLAIQECSSRYLPLHGAERLLQIWREEERRRSEAEVKLLEATEAGIVDAIMVALHEACEAGVEVSLIAAAEQRVSELKAEDRRRAARKAEEEHLAKVAAKRLHLANVELHIARSSRDAKRLEAAIAEGRALGLDGATITAAAQQLAEVQEEERLKREACESLASAVRSRNLVALHAALEAAEGVLPGDAWEVAKAREVRAQVERERRVAEEQSERQAAVAGLHDAIQRADWNSIQACQRRARALGFSEECEVMALADAALEELRDAHEVQEAKRLVDSTEARLGELAQQEAALAGSSHKKERSAIGKDILASKNDSAYLSAVRFLKNPDAERKRREDRRLASERKAAEATERRVQRCCEARQTLTAALTNRDEATVRALLEEDVLEQVDQRAAEAFLAEQAERNAATAKDGALLQFSYATLDRRAFFGASIAMNEFFTDQYSMQEGADFKLKVQKRGNSVLVAFRSADFAEVVLDTAQELALRLSSTHVVASAKICGPADFTDEVEESLPDARQDAENLQRRPVRKDSQRAINAVRKRPGKAENLGSDGDHDMAGSNSFAALAAPVDAAAAGSSLDAGASAQGAWPAATQQPRPADEEDEDGFVRVGKRGHRGEPQRAPSTYVQVSESVAGSACASTAYPGKGKSKGKTAANADDTMALPRRAAAMLQRDRAQADSFHRDLKTFAGKFRVAAELQGLECVVMKPMGFVHQETKQRARSELQRLLDYYFPERQAAVSTGDHGAGANSQAQATCRSAHLRVSEDGAGIEVTPTADGYRIDLVEDFPGQDFMPGELIVEINGLSLVGLAEEELEDAFGEHFGDGAALTVMTPAE